MKMQAAVHGTERDRKGRTTHFPGESALLASSAALAFAFVTACLFLLG